MKEDLGNLARSLISESTREVEFWIGDGTPFFDTMDSLLSSDFWYDYQYHRFMDGGHAGVADYIVVSGKWGYGFKNWTRKYQPWLTKFVTVVRGDLRHTPLEPFNEVFEGLEFVFLDNSCYQGRTRDKIKQRIEEAGGKLVTSMVIYDGSLRPLPDIKGVWRYHGPWQANY